MSTVQKIDIVPMPSQILIWDLKARTISNTDQRPNYGLQLSVKPEDVALCGNSCILTFSTGDIQVVDLNSCESEAYRFGFYAYKVCAMNERTLFLSNKTTGKIFSFPWNEPEKKHEICLWSNPGVPAGFKGERLDDYPSDRCRYSLEELSSLFHTFVSEQFSYWHACNKNEVVSVLPTKVSTDFPCFFEYGKVFYFSKDREAIVYIDFAASHEVILRQLAEILGESKGYGYAKKILERMPKPVQDGVNRILEGIPPIRAQRVDPSQSSRLDEIINDIHSMSSQQLAHVIALLQAQMEASDPIDATPLDKTDVKPVYNYDEKDRLREAILKYLESNPPVKSAG